MQAAAYNSRDADDESDGEELDFLDHVSLHSTPIPDPSYIPAALRRPRPVSPRGGRLAGAGPTTGHPRQGALLG